MSERALPGIAADGMGKIAQVFADAVDRRPTVAEFLALMVASLQESAEDRLSDISGARVRRLVPEFAPGTERRSPEEKFAPDDLTDAAYTVTADVIAGIVGRFEAATARRPTLQEFCELLARAFPLCPDDTFRDVGGAAVTDIRAELSKPGKAPRPKVGDLVAIPGSDGRLYVAVVIIARNSFGTAYGFFRDPVPAAAISLERHPPLLPYPIYSGDHSIKSGRWKIVGHDQKLLSLFPADPEIFHKPGRTPFGSGETASGKLRSLTEEEARTIGILDGRYRQGYTCDYLEACLPTLLSARHD